MRLFWCGPGSQAVYGGLSTVKADRIENKKATIPNPQKLMKKILVPCDFSDPAIQAFKFAAELARRHGSEIVLLHVVELPVMHDTVLMPTLSFEEAYLKDVRQEAARNFEQMKTRWAAEGVAITTLVQCGPTTPTIRQCVEDHQIDLVIMGTKGASGLKEFLVGSNAEKIVRTSPVPVIAIKKPITEVKNIVFPNTLNTEQEELTLKLKELQSMLGARLHVLYVNTPALFKRDTETKEQLEAFAKRFMLTNYTLNIVSDYSEEAGIAAFANEVQADLIAIGTHGRRGLNHLLSGSIAEDVVNHLDRAIWTYRAAK
jgi:nucleotide-binding universal stress UspA family protein